MSENVETYLNSNRGSHINFKKIRMWFFIAAFFILSVVVGLLKQVIFFFK
jgi:hypothetical protein